MNQHLCLAWQDLESGRYRRALKKYQQLAREKTVPINSQVYLGLAWCYNALSQPELAEDAASKALELNPSLVDPHVILASVYWQLHRFDESQKEIQTALELDPNSARAHSVLGLLLLDRKQFQEAVDHFRTAITIEPDTSSHHINLAIAYQKAGCNSAAIKEYKHALDLSYSFTTILNVIRSYIGHYYWVFPIFLLLLVAVRSICTLPLMLVIACYILINVWFYLRHGNYKRSITFALLLFVVSVLYVYHLLYGL